MKLRCHSQSEEKLNEKEWIMEMKERVRKYGTHSRGRRCYRLSVKARRTAISSLLLLFQLSVLTAQLKSSSSFLFTLPTLRNKRIAVLPRTSHGLDTIWQRLRLVSFCNYPRFFSFSKKTNTPSCLHYIYIYI